MVIGLTELVPLPANRPQMRPVKERSVADDPLGFIFPGLLRQMYQVPSTFGVNPKSSLGVIQFGYENVQNARSYNPSDIGLFNAGMNENVHVDKVVGPFDGGRNAYEPTLDVEVSIRELIEYYSSCKEQLVWNFFEISNFFVSTQYGSASGLNTTFWYWTEMVWMYDFATHLFNAKTYPLVVSMSYGWPEDGQCTIDTGNCGPGGYSDYLKRTDAEFMKIAMKGVTLVSSSGDQGAPGDSNAFCSFNNVLSNMYPATSPWVTSVGATMLIPGGSPLPPINQPPVCQQ